MKEPRLDLHVRPPYGLAVLLREAAKTNGRTLNAEIVQRLKASFEGYRKL